MPEKADSVQVLRELYGLDWAADEIERLRDQNAIMQRALVNIGYSDWSASVMRSCARIALGVIGVHRHEQSPAKEG